MNPMISTPMVWAAETVANNRFNCACCGRRFRSNKRYAVEVTNGGATAMKPGTANPDDPGFMGTFFVGPVCAERHFLGVAEEISIPAPGITSEIEL